MRNVVLFGAGAAIPWNGPRTNYVTTVFLDELNKKTRHCDPRPLRIIHDFLVYKVGQKEGFYSGFVNFEDLINVVEELILYYSDRSKLNKDYLPVIFKLSQELELEFSVFYNGEDPFNFWKEVLNDLIRTITELIYEYSWHNGDSDSKIFPTDQSHWKEEEVEKRKALNAFFRDWAKSLASEGGVIRAYTLNYDRLFKELFQWSLDTDVFEGADRSSDFSAFSPHSILKKRDEHCHYNLHGSIYWHPFEKSGHELNDWQFYLDEFPYWLSNSVEMPFITIEQGRSFLLYNIVAGYRKSQRTLLPPFKQMHASFDIDCSEADHLYLIGYSFSDQHINATIRAYLGQEKSPIIHIVDPRFDNMKGTEMLRDIIVVNFPQLFDQHGLVNGVNSSDSYPKSYLNGQLLVYPVSFEKYLKGL
jgi:hypothetical protein